MIDHNSGRAEVSHSWKFRVQKVKMRFRTLFLRIYPLLSHPE